jgi:ATP-dependent DNA helicase RecG
MTFKKQLNTCEVQKYPTMNLDFENIANGFLIQLSYKQQKISESVVEDVVENVVEDVGEKLTENQEMILQIFENNPRISAKVVSEKIGISARKVEENISKLKQVNKLKRFGPAKGGYWKVVD